MMDERTELLPEVGPDGPSEWRGKTHRVSIQSGQLQRMSYDEDGQLLSLETLRPVRSCERVSELGYVECDYLSSGRLLYGLGMVRDASLKAKGVTGRTYEARLTVTCLVCNRRERWSRSGWHFPTLLWLWKSTERFLDVGTSTLCQLEQRNEYRRLASDAWPVTNMPNVSQLAKHLRFGSGTVATLIDQTQEPLTE